MNQTEQELIRALRSEIADIEALSRDMLEFLPRIRDPHARRLWQARAELVLDAATERRSLVSALEGGGPATTSPAADLSEPVLDLGAQLCGCDSPGAIAELEALTREARDAARLVRDPHARRLWTIQTSRVLRQAAEKRACLAEAEAEPSPAPAPAAASSWRFWLNPALGILLCTAVAATFSLAGRGWGRAPLLPLVFVGVVLSITRYFGAVVGILGCVLSTAIFALYLFPPFGSFVIEDQSALTCLGVLVSSGTGLSYYLGPRLAAAKRPFLPSASS